MGPYASDSVQKGKKGSEITEDQCDWYTLLDKCFGSLEKVIESGYIYLYIPTTGPLKFGWDLEYASIFDLDKKQFQFYGIQNQVQTFDFTELPQF